jgi:hypothetical protein
LEYRSDGEPEYWIETQDSNIFLLQHSILLTRV